jgi:hypothetical protein
MYITQTGLASIKKSGLTVWSLVFNKKIKNKGVYQLRITQEETQLEP